MASGETLFVVTALANEPPSSNPATLGLRNGHPVLNFDDTTAEGAVFTLVMPRHYAGGNIVFYVHHSAAATSGTIGWTVEVERIGDGSQDVDADGFASVNTITAATVPATSGHVDIVNVSASNLDSAAAGELFRIRVKRDVANDTATGDAEFHALEAKEA